MLGFDEREQCCYCVHEAACHASHWEDGQTLRLDGCEVDGCGCESFCHDPWSNFGEKPPIVSKREEPSVTVQRLVFQIQWDYKTLAVMDVAWSLGDEEVSRLGKEGYELIESRRIEPHETHYRFRKPLLKGVMS